MAIKSKKKASKSVDLKGFKFEGFGAEDAGAKKVGKKKVKPAKEEATKKVGKKKVKPASDEEEEGGDWPSEEEEAPKKVSGKKPAGKKPAKPAKEEAKKPAGKKPAAKPAGKKPAGKKPAGKKDADGEVVIPYTEGGEFKGKFVGPKGVKFTKNDWGFDAGNKERSVRVSVWPLDSGKTTVAVLGWTEAKGLKTLYEGSIADEKVGNQLTAVVGKFLA